MYTHPDIGRLLASTRIEEQQSRLMAVPVVRAESLERDVTRRAVGRRFIPEASTAAIARRWLARQASPRTSETRTNG